MGTVSENKTDKSAAFLYQMAETGAPIIDKTPIVMECKVKDIYKTEGFESFICKIIAVHAGKFVLKRTKESTTAYLNLFYLKCRLINTSVPAKS